MIRRPPRSTQSRSSAASDVYKRQARLSPAGSVPAVSTRWDPSTGILAGPVDGPARVREAYPEVAAVPGLKVEHRGSRFGGAVVRMERDGVLIRGRSGQD